jgi:hypothetical protein
MPIIIELDIARFVTHDIYGENITILIPNGINSIEYLFLKEEI